MQTGRHQKQIKSVSVSSDCTQSLPCCHDVSVYYQDGTRKKRTMEIVEIIDKYSQYLSQKDIPHLGELANRNYLTHYHARVAQNNNNKPLKRIKREKELSDLINHLNTHIAKYNIRSSESVLSHALFQLAQLPADAIDIIPDSDNLRFFTIALNELSPSEIINKFGNNLQLFLIGQHNIHGEINYIFSVSKIFQNIALIEKTIDKILIDPRHVLAHQLFMLPEHSDESMLTQAADRFTTQFSALETEILSQIKVTYHGSDCVEQALLRAFGSEGTKSASFRNGKDFIGSMIDTIFYLGISESAAIELVANFNKKFPNKINPARFIASKIKLKNKGDDISFCEIAIDTNTICSDECRKLLKTAFEMIVEKEPLLHDKWRLDSATMRESTAEHAKKIEDIASRYQNQDYSNKGQQEQKYADALRHFSAVITDPRSKLSDRIASNDSVRRATARLESEQGREENIEFKKGDKRLMKDAQVDIKFVR